MVSDAGGSLESQERNGYHRWGDIVGCPSADSSERDE
jgi:hypothetical protein